MTGFKRLSRDIREELLEDARDFERRMAFRAARRKSERCDLDEYIRFLSENMGDIPTKPAKRVTRDFRL